MWDELVRDRGGAAIDSLAEADAVQLAGTRFVALPSLDEAVMPAVAALEPAQAAAHLTLGDTGPLVTRAAHANRFLERLKASQSEPYLLKAGRVGGTDPEASAEIKQEHTSAILNAIFSGAVEWERDPDFARTGRVYEYAALVPELKREWVARLEALDGLDPAIVDAVR
jgi:ATP-dependent phosphoenolpyruvate carboxykinase